MCYTAYGRLQNHSSMMAKTTKFTHEIALKIAIKNLVILQEHCTKIDIAGSIRREEHEVHDIEICCIPKKITSNDLFNNNLNPVDCNTFWSSVVSLGKVLKGAIASGTRYVQILLPEGIVLDLFIPIESDYYRQLVIRTGPSNYSHNTVAKAWHKLGWVGTRDGLRLKSESFYTQVRDKLIWKCTLSHPTLPPAWQSEEEFYQWLKIDYINPELRKLWSTI